MIVNYFLNGAMLIISFWNKQFCWNLAVFEYCHWNDLMYKILANCPPERAVAEFSSNSCWKQLFHYLIMKIIAQMNQVHYFSGQRKLWAVVSLKGKWIYLRRHFCLFILIGIQIFWNKNTHTHKFHTNCFSLRYQTIRNGRNAWNFTECLWRLCRCQGGGAVLILARLAERGFLVTA